MKDAEEVKLEVGFGNFLSLVLRKEGYAVCKVEEVVGKECGKTYKIGTSTSNCSDHLANIHGITQEHEEANVNQNQNIKDAFSKVTHHQESRQLELCQHLTDWIICDSQPLTVLESPAFKQLIFQLDPKFQMPNPKYIKLLIHKAYNYSKPLIMEKLEKDANAVSLTCDLWTGRNRQGFLGITSDHVGNTLLAVLDEWELRDKTLIAFRILESLSIVIIKDLELAADNIMWQPCTAHTLQLVVGKGLAPIKLIVGRAKRLIDFFMSPKQSERLEKIQKQFTQPNSNNSSRTPIVSLILL
ncbi:zinc finger BED domain-containing protein 4-like [Rhizophagus clarus]|uniref:Zinc finger BED domain-containing protein 4-like n=1 Tax=Rhizophagus clarus TaxID=94130 RepID=A0A8H3R9D1_9GLOM|nr:zinc finger BED domain-containing protein 4-like [Rhizophagus clarus]